MNKKNITLIIFILGILTVVIGSAYAYFSATITGAESSSTISIGGGTLTITVNGGNDINVSNIIPGPNAIITKTITLTGTNTTELDMPYTINLIIDENTFATGSIKYTLDSANTSSNGKTIKAISTQTNIALGPSSIDLGSGKFATGTNSIHTYVLNLYFPESGSDQNLEQGKSISAHINVVSNEASVPIPAPVGWEDSAEGTLLNTLSNTNTLAAPLTNPGRAISTSEEAVLASTEDDYGTSYYFRGSVENNYVKFANMCWRIVRVTGDGSIKLVLYNYNSLSVANPCATAYDGTSNAFARYSGATYQSAFNSSINRNAYIGFMYGVAGSASYAAEHANTNKSTVLTNLETWYTSKLLSYASRLADTIWCNDKKIETDYLYGTTLGYGINRTGYGAYGRIYADNTYISNANPSLICPNDSNGGKLSKFTADETTYGNGNLTYKIGLLTIDEAAFAGGIYNTSNSTYYLYKNATSNAWWSMSPNFFYSSAAFLWSVYPYGSFDSPGANSPGALRPAVSLLSTVTATGAGTSADPYVIS